MANIRKSHADHGKVAVAFRHTDGDAREQLNRQLELLIRAGRLDEAVTLLQQLDGLYPGHFPYLNLLGELCLKTRDFSGAVNAFSKALQLDSKHPDVYVGLGLALHEFNHFDGAAASFEIALLWRPAHHRAMGYRALSLAQLGRLEEALLLFDAAIRCAPCDPVHYLNRGQLLNRMDRHEQALDDFSKAVSLNPDEALFQLGHAAQWYRLRNHEAAMAAIDTLVQAGKADLQTLNFRGVLLAEMHRHEEALQTYDAALAIDPHHPETQFNKALLLLTLGRFELGWPLYESRWRRSAAPQMPRPDSARWDGEVPLNQSVVLVYAEQGLGDMIQFARYVPLIAARAGHVVFVVPVALLRVFERMPANVTVQDEETPLPRHDVHCPLMSLPLLLKTRLNNIPLPSLELSVASGFRFQGLDAFMLQSSIKVGVCWSGNAKHSNDHNRSISFQDFRNALDGLPAFVSLQKEIRDSDRQAIEQDGRLLQIGDQFSDLSVTAALISQLDLVITVDTSVAHLAAAMGKPTWILVAARPDFRWMLGRPDSPWYPSATLFRQSMHGDWAPVLNTVRTRLLSLQAMQGGKEHMGADAHVQVRQSA